MAFKDVATAVHGDVQKVDALRIKQGRNQDTGRVVGTKGGRPRGSTNRVALAESLEREQRPVDMNSVAGYVRIATAEANAQRWAQAAAQPNADPMTVALAQGAALEAKRVWREVRQTTQWYPEADLL